MEKAIIYLLLFSFIAFQACEKEENNNTNTSILGFVNRYDKDGALKQDQSNIEVAILDGATSKTNSSGEFNFAGLSSGKYRFKITYPDNSSLYDMATFIGPGEGFLRYKIYDKLNFQVSENSNFLNVDGDYLYSMISNTVKKPGSDSIEYLLNCIVTVYVHSDSTVSNINYTSSRYQRFNGNISGSNSGFRIRDYFDDSINNLYAVYYISNYYEGESQGKFYNEDFSKRIRSSDQKASKVFEIKIKP